MPKKRSETGHHSKQLDSAVDLLRQNLKDAARLLSGNKRASLYWSSTSDFAVLSGSRRQAK